MTATAPSDANAMLRVPASKSMTQRALLIAALGPGPTRIDNALVCDDSRHLSAGLRALGCGVSWRDSQVTVRPAPLRAPAATLALGNAGTAVRFLACTALLLDAPLTLDGDDYMRQRPIGALVHALNSLGAGADYLAAPGRLPLTLRPPIVPGSSGWIDGTLSSQYLSGLLMVAPRLPSGLTIQLRGARVSQPYVAMTLAMMRSAGALIKELPDGYRVEPGGYPAIGANFPHAVEGDWSAAAFLLVAQQLLQRQLPILGLEPQRRSLQGDAVIVDWLARLDGSSANRFSLRDTPDLIAPICAAALFAQAPTELTHIAHARVKECDRVAVLARELTRIGARIRVRDDSMAIEPLAPIDPGRAAEPIVLDPEHDHRMAMAFGVVSLRCPHVTVANRECVSKSFSDFWQQLDRLRHAATR